MTLFIAVVIMGILLFISFAVINITLKGSLFASSGENSQYAFYAADSGLECTLYWDSKVDPSKFATSTSGSPISCNGSSIITGTAIPGTTTVTLIGCGGSTKPTSVFGFDMNFGSNPLPACAIVMVTKNTNGTTYIQSRGYNTCTSDPRRVERGIGVTE